MRVLNQAHREAGYTTVMAAVLSASIVAVATTIVGLTSIVVSTHEAQVGADLAAVAAASALNAGGEACSAARQTARLNRATMVACEEIETDALVTVRVRGQEATARAGP